jgi:hypothetical protein
VARTARNLVAEVVVTIAGLTAVAGSADATGPSARFNKPTGIALDRSDIVYFAHCGNHTIRRVTAEGDVTTVAGRAENGKHRHTSACRAAEVQRPCRILLPSFLRFFPVLLLSANQFTYRYLHNRCSSAFLRSHYLQIGFLHYNLRLSSDSSGYSPAACSGGDQIASALVVHTGWSAMTASGRLQTSVYRRFRPNAGIHCHVAGPLNQ